MVQNICFYFFSPEKHEISSYRIFYAIKTCSFFLIFIVGIDKSHIINLKMKLVSDLKWQTKTLLLLHAEHYLAPYYLALIIIATSNSFNMQEQTHTVLLLLYISINRLYLVTLLLLSIQRFLWFSYSRLYNDLWVHSGPFRYMYKHLNLTEARLMLDAGLPMGKIKYGAMSERLSHIIILQV